MGDEKSARITTYRDLKAYQKSYELALEIHRKTKDFPPFERGELGSQLRRAAVSVPTNNEVSVLLELAKDLDYLAKDEYARWIDKVSEVGKMLTKLIQVWR